jgi:hypothetical protein
MDEILQVLTAEYNERMSCHETFIKNNAFVMHNVKVSRKLCSFLTIPSSSQITRIEIYRKLYLYGMKNKLIQTDSTMIINESLRLLFKPTNNKSISLSLLPEMIEHHIKDF